MASQAGRTDRKFSSAAWLTSGALPRLLAVLDCDGEEARAMVEAGVRRDLDGAGKADPDLRIRTGGQCRLSNFLLWQSSYSEIWITSDLWPDFDVPRLEEALEDYRSRERKYGALVGSEESSREPRMPILGGVLNDE